MDDFKKTITFLAVAGNILFILWIVFNGINEGFQGTLPEIISYVSLILLLAVNTILLLRKKRGSRRHSAR